MQNYKLAVTKNGKKYTIVFKAETEKLARERVHNEWYSILSIEEINKKDILWNTFLFTVTTKEWDIKNGKIVWDDIFKVYIKLRKNLEYDVKLLFSEKDNDLDINEKKKIISDLEEEYKLLYTWKKKERLDILREKIKEENNNNSKSNNDNKLYLLK